MTVEDAMKKWKNLRDYFVRENKKVKKDLLVVKALHMYQDGLYLTNELYNRLSKT